MQEKFVNPIKNESSVRAGMEWGMREEQKLLKRTYRWPKRFEKILLHHPYQLTANQNREISAYTNEIVTYENE